MCLVAAVGLLVLLHLADGASPRETAADPGKRLNCCFCGWRQQILNQAAALAAAAARFIILVVAVKHRALIAGGVASLRHTGRVCYSQTAALIHVVRQSNQPVGEPERAEIRQRLTTWS